MRLGNVFFCRQPSGHVSLFRQSLQAEAEEQHLLLLLPVQLWEVSVNVVRPSGAKICLPRDNQCGSSVTLWPFRTSGWLSSLQNAVSLQRSFPVARKVSPQIWERELVIPLTPAVSFSSTEYHTQYYEFTGVGSCWDVIHLHRLLWASVVLNVISLFLGIVTAAILGAYKDLVGPSLLTLYIRRLEAGGESRLEV